MNLPACLCWLLAIAITASTVESHHHHGGHYLVYVLDAAHMDDNLNISVSIFNVTKDTNVKIELQETRNHTAVVSLEDTISPNSTKMLHLALGVLTNYNYQLVINGTGGLAFNDSTFVHIRRGKEKAKRHAIFIQTDKQIYKPLDKIKFRVFGILAADLLASKSPMNISISDANRNIMLKWTNMMDPTGVVSLEYELSDQPLYGNWQIRVEQENQKKTQSIEVKEYVLPDYEVVVDAPKYIYNLGSGLMFMDQEDIHVNVTAKYTFGKLVHGQLVLNVSFGDSWNGLRMNFTQHTDGHAHISFNIKDFAKTDLVRVPRYPRFCIPRTLRFDAMVMEDLTGKKMHSLPVTSSIVNAPIEVKIDTPIVFKRGLPAKVNLHVTRKDEHMLTEEDRHYPLNVVTKHGKGLQHTAKYHIPKNGSIEFDLLLPANEDGSVTITALYTGTFGKNKYEIKETVYPSEFENDHQENIEATLLQKHVHVGEDVKIFLNSTAPITWALITVVSDDRMLSNEIKEIKDKTSFVVEIPTSEIMIPSVTVLISCSTKKGKFMIDAVTERITISFKNDVVGTFDKDKGRPGTNVDFKGKTKPGSAVFVMAVDKKLHLLKSAEYITKDKVYDALVGSDNSHSFFSRSDSPGDILSQIGMQMMTNYIKLRRRMIMYTRTGVNFVGAAGPMAVPVAENSVSAKVDAPRIRKDFPETWIWVDVEADENGDFTFNKKVPDSITTWVANSFALHPEEGLGIMNQPVKFLSFQDFFIHPILPYSLIRGESFILKVSIFSNLTQDQEVTVTLLESSQFKLKKTKADQTVTVKAHGDNTVQYHVITTEVGHITFKIRAECELASDEIHKDILVKPEGYAVHKNKVTLVKVVTDEPTEFDYEIEHNPDAVKDSERVEVSVIADIMGPSLEGFGNQVRIPSGCGEQNMINMAPNIYIHDYLKAELKLTPELFKRIKTYTLRGYKNEMQYQRHDGSFSAFGKRDKQGSTWLTAFVLLVFGQSRKSIPEIYIDEDVFRQGIHWLIGKRTKQNLFREDGRVIHENMQGGASQGYALTVYTLISLHQNQDILPNVTKPVIEEVSASLPIHDNDTYTLGMMLYLMALTNDDERFEVIETILEEKAIIEDEMKYWKIEHKPKEEIYYESPSSGIEVSSYILMAYTKKGRIEEAIPIMKWLMSQRNSLGGFHSTQDTILGLEALALFATHVKSPQSLTVTVTSDNTNKYTFPEITPLTSTILYKHVLPAETKHVHVKAAGETVDDATHSYAMVQISSQYNVKLGSAENIFEGKVEYKALTSHEMALDICHRLKKMNLTGMVLIEATLPSGYSLTNKRELLDSDNISKVELDDTKVILYLNELTTNLSCYELKASKVYEVMGHSSPLPVSIRLYYQPDKVLVTMYQITGGSE